jgi:hypothetical protein
MFMILQPVRMSLSRGIKFISIQTTFVQSAQCTSLLKQQALQLARLGLDPTP